MAAPTESTFDEVFREQFPRLVAIGASMTGDRELARDLAQETMVRAHRNWATVCGYESPEAWLRRVLHNLLVDHHRRRRVRKGAALHLVGTGDVHHDPDISRWAELVAPLAERQRIVATLFYVDDQSVEQIATALDISAGTVKSTLAKARATLARRIDADENEGAADG